MDHQTEQVQVERPEDEIEDLADLARSLLECLRDLDAELCDSLLIEPLLTSGPRHLRRRPPELRRGCGRAPRERAEERPEQASIRVRRDREMQSIKIDDQPEQRQVQ